MEKKKSQVTLKDIKWERKGVDIVKKSEKIKKKRCRGEQRAETVQTGLWGYETSSGNIPQPQLSHGEKTKSYLYAVNFIAL